MTITATPMMVCLSLLPTFMHCINQAYLKNVSNPLKIKATYHKGMHRSDRVAHITRSCKRGKHVHYVTEIAHTTPNQINDMTVTATPAMVCLSLLSTSMHCINQFFFVREMIKMRSFFTATHLQCDRVIVPGLLLRKNGKSSPLRVILCSCDGDGGQGHATDRLKCPK